MISMSTTSWEALLGFFLSSSPWIGNKKCSWKFLMGLFLIILQCIIAVVNAILTQILFEEYDLQSPFLMTYVGVSMMAFLLPLHVGLERYERSRRQLQHRSMDDAKSYALHTDGACGSVASVPEACCVDTTASFDSLADDLNRTSDLVEIATRRTNQLMQDHRSKWNHRKHILAALLIAPAMFVADWAFNAALLRTSIASCTVLVSIQSVFVYVLAVLWKLELYSGCKLLGVMAAVAGTALTALHDVEVEEEKALQADDDDDAKNQTYRMWSGDMLAVMAAVAYATYTIQVRLFCPEDEQLYSTRLLLGYIGTLTLVPLSPIAVWVVWNEEQIAWAAIALLLVKGLFDFCITDYLLFRSIILTGPTVSTVGLGLSIPMAFLADLFLLNKDNVLSWFSCGGAMACLMGFLLVNLVPDDPDCSCTPQAHESGPSSSSPPAVKARCGNDKLQTAAEKKGGQLVNGVR